MPHALRHALRSLWMLCLAAAVGLFGLFGLPTSLPAQDVQPVPGLSGRVVDVAGVLTAEQRSALDAKLAGFEAQAGPQIVLLLIASSQPEDISSYAQRVADAWKIGRREVGDGLLLVVARDDRRVRIEVAKALEGAVPDLAARQIIDRDIAPAFKRGDYAGGLNAAIDSLMARVRGEGLPQPKGRAAPGDSFGGFGLPELGLFFFIAVPVFGALLTRVMGRKLGSLATAGGTGALAWTLTTSALIAGLAGVAALVLVGVLGFGAASRRGVHGGSGLGGGLMGGLGGALGGGLGGGWGRSGGGGGGGGFSSGGGGDFGGGGASGDW